MEKEEVSITEFAGELIDEVCSVIENWYPELKPKELEKGSGIDKDTLALINGIPYYDLEAEIISKLKGFIQGKCIVDDYSDNEVNFQSNMKGLNVLTIGELKFNISDNAVEKLHDLFNAEFGE